MAAAAGLSSLPDHLLCRILYFAPGKEAASTAVLSRRWRSLWLASGGVNLDSRWYDRTMAAALSAAAAGGEPVRRLTLHVDATCYEIHFSKAYSTHGGPRHDMAAALLASPAARAVEELAVVIAPRPGFPADRLASRSALSFGALPSETLRALHAANVGCLAAPPPAAAFPRLAELRLRTCGVSIANLQRVVDAAPQLATLHLDRYSFGERRGHGSETTADGWKNSGGRLVCPAVTDLVLADCSWPLHEVGKVDLDVPKLEYFRYKGSVRLVMERLFLKLPAASPGVVRLDLHFDQESWRNARTPEVFWEFLQSFNTAKVLKLKMDLTTDHVDLAKKHEQDKLTLTNRLLCKLERLEVEVPREPAGETLALFIANLLRCCPVVRDLHLKLTSKASDRAGIEAWSEFDRCIDHFRHHRKSPRFSLNADEDENYVVSDIHFLSDHSFDCLKSCLRTVILKFWMQGPNCFEVQLAKFFAKNAMVLQQISIDDGNHRLRDHMNRMIRKWVPGSSISKNSPITTAFRMSYHRKRQREDGQYLAGDSTRTCAQ
ncbi:unnamed protein product [Urochloa decumbens]|uniref:F-box domain-containing protein n=1 Tax=Urochloa decumbens TaxID=240449 RepID=A0ABC9B540_9POAL